MRVVLLDLDGVLVEPRGYRAATRATVAWFYEQWGWRAPLPAEEDMAAFEAHGITSEWDMVPLMLAWVVETFLRHYGEEALPAHIMPPAEATPPRRRLGITPPPFRLVPPRVTPLLRDDMEPALAVYRAMQERPEDTPFPRLARTPWAEGLLGFTRDVVRAPTTFVFQNYALGSQGFEDTYGVPPRVATPSLLAQEDRALLSPEGAATLWAGHRAGRWRLAIFTRRPTKPSQATLGYPPEAELALERVGLPQAPTMGQGHLAYWARARKLNYEAVMKPSPVHPLGALLMALGMDWMLALDAAYAFLMEGGEPPVPPDGWPPSLEVVALEDAWVGLRAVGQALQALTRVGLSVQGRFFGVARDETKVKALNSQGVPVFPTPDAALQAAGVLAPSSKGS